VAVVPLETVWTKPSDQVRVNGSPSPLIVAAIMAGAPEHDSPSPLTTAETGGAGVAVALPLEVPPLQRASRREVMVYTVDDAGETWRVAVEPLETVCTKPSDHVMVYGARPVSAALIVVFAPSQNVPPPLTVTVGTAAG
jgi:hypothetical protein